MRRLLIFTALCALLIVGLAGCGSPSSARHTPSPTTPATGPRSTRCAEGVMGGCVSQSKAKLALPRITGTLVPDVSEFNEGCALHSEAIFRVYEAGTEREDTKAPCHASELNRLHTWAAVYTFLRSYRSCVLTADRTVVIARSLPVHVQVVVGDAETGIREGKVACFLHEVERDGYPAREYTCPGCGDEQVGPIWIAAYPYRPAGSWIAHQFSDAFNCRGVVGDCSVDEGILAIHTGPTHEELVARWKRELGETNTRIVVFRNLLAKYRCRIVHGSRAAPACPEWAQDGREEHARARQLEALIHT